MMAAVLLEKEGSREVPREVARLRRYWSCDFPKTFKMANLLVVACLLGVTFSSVIAHQDGVPALLWTNQASEFPPPLAGHTTQQDEFKTDYLQHISEKAGHTLVAFVQNKLSLEDIIDNADVYNEHSTGSKFSNLKRLVETHTSVHLPAVSSPGDALNKLMKEFKGKIHHLNAPYNIKDLPLDSAGPNLVIANLPKNDGKSFDKIDGIIGSVSEDLESLKVPFTALYTGEKSSQAREEAAYTGRHLLATADASPSYYFNVSDCILMFYKKLVLQVQVFKGKDKDKKLDYTSTYDVSDHGTVDQASTACSNDTTTGNLTINFAPRVNLTKFTLTMSFKRDRSGYWKSSLSVKYTIENSTIEGSRVEGHGILNTKGIYGPMKFSYHCTTPYPIAQIGAGNVTSQTPDSLATLRISSFQVQFGKRAASGKFGRANDCEGFFSAPVLSGLMAGLLLTSILAFGICMILNISTMDRFDDPKGKSITVNTSD